MVTVSFIDSHSCIYLQSVSMSLSLPAADKHWALHCCHMYSVLFDFNELIHASILITDTSGIVVLFKFNLVVHVGSKVLYCSYHIR